MSKVHPQAVAAAAAAATPTSSPNEDIRFTIWMKSLVLNGFGCTIFDSSGQIVYRVDNYNHKCRNRVFLMDNRGKVLFTILKKKYFRMFGCWEIHTHDDLTVGKPGFQVRRIRGGSLVMGFDKNQPHEYKMAPTSWGNYKSSSSSSCKIFDKSGVLVAELKRKRSTSGVDLGKDVLALEMVEPSISVDHYSCIMALIVVYGLHHRKL